MKKNSPSATQSKDKTVKNLKNKKIKKSLLVIQRKGIYLCVRLILL